MDKTITRLVFGILCVCCALLSPQKLCAQTMDEIKGDPKFIWGQGVAETLQSADDLAWRDLQSQIYVNVDTRTETSIANEVSGDEAHSSISTSASTKMSSNITLSNCNRLVDEQQNYVVVLRYVAREEVDKMFDARKVKIFDLIAAGEKAEEKAKVADALRNYYWALKMSLSIPEEHRTNMLTPTGRLVTTDLRERIGNVLDSVQISVKKVEKEDDSNNVELTFRFHGQPVTNCDYNFFDGFDWLTASVKDGLAVVEGVPADSKSMMLRLEYVFEKLWKSDPMVLVLLEQQPSRIPYRQAEKRVDLTKIDAVAPEAILKPKQVAKEMTVDTLSAACNKKEVFNQADVIAPLLKAMELRQYDDARALCSENGWKWFEKLVKYGNAKIVERKDLQITAFANGYLVRGIKASFSFKKNNKSFVEDLVFYIKDEKIEGINFGLEQGALEDILRHDMWDAYSRLVLVNFLENYKTAYALERLDYLNAVFSDDALIIVGNKIPQPKASDVQAVDQVSYEHNRLTKNQYMAQLERVFAKQEYVNIQFEDAQVKKTNRTSERYEIVIKQNYYSATYADKGYLYLLADISNPEQPTIYVRVWDEDRNNLMNYGEWIF